MDLGKLLSPEGLASPLCSRGRVVSAFGAGVLASLLVFSLLFSAGGNGGASPDASAPSLLSRFFSAPGDGPRKGSPAREPVEQGRAWEIAGSGGNASEKAGLRGGSRGDGAGLGSGSCSDLEGKFSKNGTVEGGVTKQGDGWEGSSNGSFTGLGGGIGSLEPQARGKPHGRSSSGNLTETSSRAGGQLPAGSTNKANLSLEGGNTRISGAGTVEDRTNKTDLLDAGVGAVERKGNQTVFLVGEVNGSAGTGGAKEKLHAAAETHEGSGSGRMNSGLPGKCDIFYGRWVRDENKQYYPPGSCPHIDVDFNCHGNGRPDSEFLRWRWQPNDCDIPSMNATDFLKRLRDQRLIFVGDSLNRNMWESLVCILRHGVRNKTRVYEMSGRKQFKTNGYYSFIFKDYNCSIDFVRSPFLVRELYTSSINGSEDEKLRLDAMDATTLAYREADIVVFNTGHWWTHEKTSRGVNYYQEGRHVYPVLEVMEAYKKALSTWAKWVDKNINPYKTQVVFRGFSLTHFSGGQWNSGGQCHKEFEPIFNQSFVRKYPAKMMALEQILKQMKTPVIYLNISLLTDYRKDGHPSIYRKKYKSVEEQISTEKLQDCSHWCLPGIPDAWNELLYASLLMVGRGSWRN